MHYDIAMKCISTELSRDLTTLIFNRRLNLEPLPTALPSTEHRADFLAKVISDEDFIIHIEFQTRYDPDMPVRMVSYYGRILHEHRLPVYPIVVYISPEDAGRKIESTYRSHILDTHVMTFDYAVISVWELETGSIFENKLYGLYPLTLLMKDADVDRCIREIVDAVKHKHLNVDACTCARIFAELKYPEEVVKAMSLDDLEKLMKESRFYKETFGKGREEGREGHPLCTCSAFWLGLRPAIHANTCSQGKKRLSVR
jgi:predicted transposase YdaD